tara:strand:- start:1132 stop:1653 length:522 start_codon:yes stop_codon:yes gene_type:complete
MIGVVAISENYCIAKDGKIPWTCPEDLKSFKELTSGNTVVMGKKTWESIGEKPLPNRKNVVLSRGYTPGPEIDTSKTVNFWTLDIFFPLYNWGNIEGKCFVIGGLKIYELLSDHIKEFYVSKIKTYVKDGSLYMPFDFLDAFECISQEKVSSRCDRCHYIRTSEDKDENSSPK